MTYRISILGLGLMGGSMAMALRGFRSATIIGANRTASVCEQALKADTVDEAYTDFKLAVQGADLVIFATYAQHVPTLLSAVRDNLKDGCILTDMCGVKLGLYEELQAMIPAKADYVGIHPMAGKEQTGFANAEAAIFQNSGFIICPWADTKSETIELMRELALYIGSDRIVITDAATHDRFVAYSSGLMHISASSLCLDMPPGLSNAFTGGAFRDCTRIADIDAEAWTELLIENSQNNLVYLEQHMQNLGRIRDALKSANAAELNSLLLQAGENKRHFMKLPYGEKTAPLPAQGQIDRGGQP